MARKRLTRREIVQEDKIRAILTGIYQWSAQNRSWLVAVFAVVVVTILVSYFWQTYEADRSQEFQVKFAEALEIYHASVGEESSDEEEDEATSSKYHFQSDQERREKALERFSAIAEDAPGWHIGLLASYYTALIKQELGQTEEAQQILNSLIEESTETQIKNLARSLLAQIAQLMSDHQRATTLLEEILEENSSSFPKEVVLLQLAHNYEAAGNAEQALKFYKRLIREYPTSEYSQQARSHTDRLETDSGLVPQN